MKAKVILMLLLAGMLSACSLDDDDDEWTSTMETWEVNIEPEYVMGYSYWGAYTSMGKQMEGVNDKGEQIGRFFPGEIEGFTFEEGYRYKLLVYATSTDPRIMDAPKYHFKLRKLLSKEYVGVRTEGRREVTMDVRRVVMLPDSLSSNGLYYLTGRNVDGDEKLDMIIEEIIGANYDMFIKYDEADIIHKYACRMRLSITPSEHYFCGKHRFRVRLEELISQQEAPEDSVVVAATYDEFELKAKEWY